MATVNSNQFGQTPLLGQVDLQITNSGVLTGLVSANQATALKAGDAVVIDPSGTTGIQFIAAADGAACFGIVLNNTKQSSFSAGDKISVAHCHGPAVYVMAGATVAPGASVEFASGVAQTLNTGKIRGIAIEPGVSGYLFRIVQTSVEPS